MGKSLTQKRRREAEAEQERRQEESGAELPKTADAVGTAAARPSKKARTEDRRSIFVRSLPSSATSEKLTEFFSEHFPVKHATVVTDPKTKESRGYGFVTFTDAEDAREAKAKLDNQLLDGRRLRLDIAEPRSRPTATNNSARAIADAAAAADKKKQREEEMIEARKAPKLIIRNLPWSIKTSQDLAKLFTMYGKVKFADLPNNKGKMAGFGFVTLRGKKNAETAIEAINGKIVDGRTLAVDFAVEKTKWDEMQQDEDVETAKVEKAEKENKKAAKEPKEPNATIFVRNLPFTTTDTELKAHFDKFAPVRYARIVMDRATDRPAGTGFVCFVSGDDAKQCLRTSPRNQQTSAVGKHSVLQDERIDRDGRYTLGGRVLQLAQAVSKNEATQLFEDGPAAQRAREKDKRRLFLLSEGTIAVGSPLYKLLPPNEIQLRETSAKQRMTMVKSNPSLHMSLTRLAIRNLPRHIDSKGLKELARKAIVGFATDVKEGLREPLAKEELARGGQQDREAEQLRRAKGKGVVKQAKVVYESERGSKVDEASGGGKSRGYGFIEFHSHRWALTGLRWLNGHAVKSDNGNKTNRLVVEFAIENANVVARRKMLEERSRQPRPPPGSKPAGQAEGGDRRGKFGDNKFQNNSTNSFNKNSRDSRDRKGGRRDRDDKKDGKKDSNSGKGTLDPKAAKGSKASKDKDGKGKDGKGKEEPKSAKQEKVDAKLVARSQIIQRKRMMRKKKGGR
ncbi:nucleolar protein [Ophiostoma piceae UAMH 11346]|uniref:Nucleolar protein n=1 Tax=Ophiostoma piceae (strain UAMH 11346) TaxID=1262450 RepID=S3BZQ5_OPHP1|nr:nucleolar protein [Ophiostoma piceae UAMH 11346]